MFVVQIREIYLSLRLVCSIVFFRVGSVGNSSKFSVQSYYACCRTQWRIARHTDRKKNMTGRPCFLATIRQFVIFGEIDICVTGAVELRLPEFFSGRLFLCFCDFRAIANK